MRKDNYTKPTIEVVRLETGNIMTLSQDTGNATELDDVIFGSKKKNWYIDSLDEDYCDEEE